MSTQPQLDTKQIKDRLKAQRDAEAFEKMYRKELQNMLRAMIRRDLPLVFFRDDTEQTVRIWHRDEAGSWYNISNTVGRLLNYQLKDKAGLLYSSVYQLIIELSEWIEMPDEMVLADNSVRRDQQTGEILSKHIIREPQERGTVNEAA